MNPDDPAAPQHDPVRSRQGTPEPLWGPPRRSTFTPSGVTEPVAPEAEPTVVAWPQPDQPDADPTVAAWPQPGQPAVVTAEDPTVGHWAPQDSAPTVVPDLSPGPAQSRRSPGVIIALAATGVVLLGGLTWGLIALMQPAVPPVPARSGGTAIAAPSTSGAASVTTTPMSANGLVRLAPSAAAAPSAQSVIDLLDRHFTAINRRDYAGWAATVVPRRVERQPQGKWMQTYRSTTDENVVVSAITPTARGLDVTFSFTSRQDVADAPPDLRVPTICWQARWPVVDGRLDTPESGTTTRSAC